MIRKKHIFLLLLFFITLQLFSVTSARANNSYFYFWLGEQAKSDHHYEEADSLFHLAQIMDPNSEKIVIERMSVLYFQQKFEKIINIGVKSIEQGFTNSDIFLMVADSYKRMGENKRAVKILKRYLRNKDHKNHKIYFLLYQIYSEVGDKDLAFHYLKKSEKLAEDNPDFLYKISQIYAQIGEDEEFIKTLKKILAINPDHYHASLWLGDYYFNKRDFTIAAKYFEHIFNLTNTLPPIQLRELIISLFYTDNFQKILDIANYYSIHSLDFFIKKIIFDTYFQMHNYEKNVEFGEKYIVHNPNANAETLDTTYEMMALSEFHLQNFEKSSEYFFYIQNLNRLLTNFQSITEITNFTHDTKLFDKVYTFSKTKNDTLHNVVKTFYSFYYASNDSIAKAKQILAEIDTTYFKNPIILNSLAYIYLKTDNDTTFARHLLDLRENPVESTSMTLGNFYYGEELFEKSIPFCLDAIREDSTQVKPYYRLSSVYNKLGQEKKEMEILQIALKKFPNNPHFLNQIGYSYAEDGINLNEAVKLLQKAVSIDSENVHIWDSLAWAFFQSGQYEKALDAMQIVIDSDRQDSIIYYHLGNIFWKLGKLNEAKKQWEASIKIGNSEDGVIKSQQMLEKIKQVKNRN